jgi:hypothetical protein
LTLFIAIVGSRTFNDPETAKSAVFAAVARIAVKHPTATIVSGGARGVDTWANDAARSQGLPCVVLKPDWDKHGRAAGLLRNTEIVEASTHILGFWNGFSRGTQDTLSKAKKAGKPVSVWVEKHPGILPGDIFGAG